MGIRSEKAKGKIILRNSESGELAGQIGEGKHNLPTVAQVAELSRIVRDAESMAYESNQREAYDYYYEKRDQLEKVLLAKAKVVLATLKEGNKVNATFIRRDNNDSSTEEYKFIDRPIEEFELDALRNDGFLKLEVYENDAFSVVNIFIKTIEKA